MADDALIERVAERFERIACVKCGLPVDVSTAPLFSTVRCFSCETPQVVPAQLSTFLLIGHLGTGGMASVYEAYDRALGRRVAIKLLHTRLSEDPKFVEGFLREARAAAQINHPNVVAIYQVGQEKDTPFIVMELLKGGGLETHTRSGKPLDETKALRIALDVAQGLRAADAIHLVHGDIQPSNIRFDEKGNAKITDFGLARFQGQKVDLEDGGIWGTPFYMAPERVRRQKEDARSDIYSLGATIYHALTGHPPFEGTDAKTVVLARLKSLPKPMTDHRPGLHPDVTLLIGRMLESDPSRRYPNYVSLIGDIQRTLKHVKDHPAPGALPAAESPAASSAGKSRKSLYAGIAAVALAAVGGLAVALSDKGGKSKPAAPPVAAGGGGTVVSAETEPLVPVEPFTPGEGTIIATGADLLAKGKTKEAIDTWINWVNTAPTNHPGRPWIVLFYALPAALEGDWPTVDARTRQLLEKKYTVQPDGSPHPALMPQAIARGLEEGVFVPPLSTPDHPWPTWYPAVSSFFESFMKFRRSDMHGGRVLMLDYSKKPPSDSAWPYSFQPLAKNYLGHFSKWDEVSKKADGLLKEGRHLEALETITRAINEMPGTFGRLFGGRLSEAGRGLKSKWPGNLIRLGATVKNADSDMDGEKRDMALDGNPGTIWHSRYVNYKGTPLPHWIIVDVGREITMRGLLYLPRQSQTKNGMIRKAEVYVGNDEKNLGFPVATVEWPDSQDPQLALFKEPVKGRLVKLMAWSEILGQDFTAVAELDVLTDDR